MTRRDRRRPASRPDPDAPVVLAVTAAEGAAMLAAVVAAFGERWRATPVRAITLAEAAQIAAVTGVPVEVATLAGAWLDLAADEKPPRPRGRRPLTRSG